MLERVIQEFASIIKRLWYKYFKNVNITKYSKAWWNKECNRDLAEYQTPRKRIDWIKYKKSVRTAKRIFFYNRIQEVMLTNKRP